MPNNLTIKSGSTVTLEDSMPPDFAVQPQRLMIEKLEDLVSAQIVNSPEALGLLLDAAKAVTEERLRERATYVPFVPVPGTSRPDLRRFGSFMARVPEVSTKEIRSFWRIARTIDPVGLASTTVSSQLLDISKFRLPFIRYFFEDITIEAGAMMVVSEKVNHIGCRHLLVQKTGRIVVKGGASLFISASSIRGEQ